MRPMLFYVDTGAPISDEGDNVLEMMVYSVGWMTILIFQPGKDFQFGDIVIRSQGMVEISIQRLDMNNIYQYYLILLI